MNSNANRQLLQSGYVLHQRPYRDTSALIEVFSETHGRVGLVARGVRGRRNQRQALLQPFNPLLLSWSGRGELFTLVDVESRAPGYMLQGMVLMSGFYVNELLMRLLRRQDPHSELFLYYDHLLKYLAELDGQEDSKLNLQIALRMFEKHLLEGIGYGLVLDCDCHGEALEPEGFYRYSLDSGFIPVPNRRASSELIIRGAHLQALANGQLDGESARGVKKLLREAIDQQLGGKPLQSRQMLMDMQRGIEGA